MSLDHSLIHHYFRFQDDKPKSLSVQLASHFAPSSAFPVEVPVPIHPTSPAETFSPDPPTKELIEVYVSESKLQELIDLYKKEILLRFVPDLIKEGYQTEFVIILATSCRRWEAG